MYTLSIREGEGEVGERGVWGVNVVWNMRWFALANCPVLPRCYRCKKKRISTHDRNWESGFFFIFFLLMGS